MPSKLLPLHSFGAALTAALALACMPAAHAADAILGELTPSLSSTFQIGFDAPMPVFLDALSFTLATDVTASFSAKGQGFSIPGLLTLTGSPDVTFAVYKGATALTGFGTTFTDLSLSAGADYAFLVQGSTGGYSVTWSVTPVPEPGVMAMVLAGAAAVGSLTRRRKPQA